MPGPIQVVTVPREDQAYAEHMMSSVTKEMRWSQASYSPRQFFETYHDDLPQFVKVANGVHGENRIDTVAQNEIIRVHEISAQPRILVKNDKNKLLSIPADWPIKVRVLIKKDRKAKLKSLADVVESYHLPVRVAFDKSNKWKFSIGSQLYTNKKFGEMEVVGYYTERYLTGNAIHNGVFHKKIVVLPLYMDINLHVAEGVVKGTDEDWEGLKEMYKTIATTIDFQSRIGTRDMLLYNYSNFTLNMEISAFVRTHLRPASGGGDKGGGQTERITTETTEISTSTTAKASTAQDHDKSDSGKASGSSGSLSSADKLKKDFQDDEGTQTDTVTIEMKAEGREGNATVKSSDSGVYTSKGEDPRMAGASRQFDEGFVSPPIQDLGGTQVVYVPIRDPEYEEFKAWKMRNEMMRQEVYTRQPLPSSFTTSRDTLYAGDGMFDDYPSLSAHGRGRYGMVLAGGGGHYGTVQARRPLPFSQPLRYGTSLSGSDTHRREMTRRVYTDFEDGVDGLGKPPLYNSNSVTKIYIDDNQNVLDSPTKLSSSQSMRATLQSSGSRSISGSYRDLYNSGGLHIGLAPQERTHELRSDDRGHHHYPRVDGGYPRVEEGGYMVLPSPSLPAQRQGEKIRRRLSSSHKYANARAGLYEERGHGERSEFQQVLVGSNRPSRFDQYYSTDSLQPSRSNSVKRSSSFVNVTSGRVSRGPSTVTRHHSDAVRTPRTQHRSASAEVISRQGYGQEAYVQSEYRVQQHKTVQQSQMVQNPESVQQSPAAQAHSVQNSHKVQQSNMKTPEKTVQQTQQAAPFQVLDSNPDISYSTGEQNLSYSSQHIQSYSHTQHSHRQYTNASQAERSATPTKQELNRSTSSGRYDVEKVHRSATHASAMPMSELHDSNSSKASSINSNDAVDGRKMADSKTKSYSRGYNVQKMGQSVQSIPELSDTSSSSNSSVSGNRTERQNGVSVVTTPPPPPTPPLREPSHPLKTTTTTTSLKTEKNTSSTTQPSSPSKAALHDELHRKIAASKVASQSGINHQVVGNGNHQYSVQSKSYTEVQKSSSEDKRASTTSLRQAYASRKPAHNSAQQSTDVTTFHSSSQITSKPETMTLGSGSQTVITREVQKNIGNGNQTVVTTKEVQQSGYNAKDVTQLSKTSAEPSSRTVATTATETKPSGGQTTITTKETKSATRNYATTTSEATTATKSTTTMEVTSSGAKTQTQTSETTTVTTTTSNKVLMRTKSETAMAYEQDIRESIRQLDDYLKTQDTDNLSMDSQSSSYVMGEPLSVGPPNLETWHF